MKSNELPPHAQIMQFILGKWISKPIYVVAELGIADMLSDGPKSIEELAQTTEVHELSLYRIMRALACLGIFSEMHDGRFELTPMAECLKSDALRPIALMMHSDWHDKAWGNLFESVKTGEKAFDSIIDTVRAEKVIINSIENLQPTLEDVFLDITGSEMRDKADKKIPMRSHRHRSMKPKRRIR